MRNMVAKEQAVQKKMPQLDVDFCMKFFRLDSGALRVTFTRRSPHHPTTSVSLIGGSIRVSPGKISLAHRGVLFLDELSEFKPSVLDALREPFEFDEICDSRANFQLEAAMKLSPCGYVTDAKHECGCSEERFARYSRKLSGPLLDRIDLINGVLALSQT